MHHNHFLTKEANLVQPPNHFTILHSNTILFQINILKLGTALTTFVQSILCFTLRIIRERRILVLLNQYF